MSALTDVDKDINTRIQDFKASEKYLQPSRSSSTSSASSSSIKEGGSSSNTTRRKIQLSEDQLHGPFNFMDHRPRKDRSSKSSSIRDGNSASSAIAGGSAGSSSNRKQNKTPTLVDLSNSPPVVDLSQSDSQEIRDLYQSLISMFPTTPIEYLEEQAEELAGKPAALERFITEHLGRNSQPPDYWQAKVQNVQPKIEPGTSSTDVIENAGVVNLSREGQGINMTMDAMEVDGFTRKNDDVVVEYKDNESDTNSSRPRISRESSLDEVDMPEPMEEDLEPKPGPSRPFRNDVNNETIDLTDFNDQEAGPSTAANQSNANNQESEEDRANKRLETLVTLFPHVDPEFLHTKAVEFGDNEDQMNRWIQETLENNTANDFPSRQEYEKRQKEAEMLEKYSGQVTIQEILDMYEDPEAYFMDKTRVVSDLYKKHSLTQLKKEFRQISVNVINKIFTINNGLFVPCVRALKKYSGVKRKTRRPDHECCMPTEIDINFLKELQYSRIEADLKQYINEKDSAQARKIEEAKEKGTLMECVCCYNDECLADDMLPCGGGHLFCKECVQRASEVAIGDGKLHLTCLGHCEEVFALATLQKALKANTFSKWLKRIQLAEIEKADIEGLEQCPFCPFATIMDTKPEENKLFMCQNPDCGKESCRMCKEISHIPLRCEEVEKDAEVRKRTYIENKMTEAMIRKCWKCSKPFVKLDGCNKMTCDCGASMCYLCRQPVKDYKHFYGQGGMPQPGQNCPLWSDNSQIHESDVARGAIEAKNEMDRQNPDVKLKHDPAKDVNLAAAERPREAMVGRGRDFGLGMMYLGLGRPPAAAPVPPGLEGILPDDPLERMRLIQDQERIERMIRGPAGGPPGMGGHHHHHHHLIHQHALRNLNAGAHNNAAARDLNDAQGFVNRMGELLQLREAHRQRQRAIRQREQQLLQDHREQRLREEYQIRRIAHPDHNQQGQDGQVVAAVANNAAAAAGGPPPPHFGQRPVGVPQGPPAGPMPVMMNPMPAHNVQPAPPLPPPPPAHGGREPLPPQAHREPMRRIHFGNDWGWGGMVVPRHRIYDAPPAAAAPVPPAGRLGAHAGGPFQIRVEQRQQLPRPVPAQQQPQPQPPPQHHRIRGGPLFAPMETRHREREHRRRQVQLDAAAAGAAPPLPPQPPAPQPPPPAGPPPPVGPHQRPQRQQPPHGGGGDHPRQADGRRGGRVARPAAPAAGIDELPFGVQPPPPPIPPPPGNNFNELDWLLDEVMDL